MKRKKYTLQTQKIQKLVFTKDRINLEKINELLQIQFNSKSQLRRYTGLDQERTSMKKGLVREIVFLFELPAFLFRIVNCINQLICPPTYKTPIEYANNKTKSSIFRSHHRLKGLKTKTLNTLQIYHLSKRSLQLCTR